MKRTLLFALFLCLLINRASAQQPCQSLLCQTLAKALKENADLRDENRRLKGEIIKYKRLLADKNNTIRALEKKIKELEEKANKQSAEAQKNKEELKKQSDYQSSMRQKAQKDSMEIVGLRQDSIASAQQYARFQENHLIIDDGTILTVIPYDIPLGPIDITGNPPNVELKPTMEEAEFFMALRYIKPAQKVKVLVQIKASAGRMDAFKEAIERDMRRRCPNCEIEMDEPTRGDKKGQVALIFVRPPRRP